MWLMPSRSTLRTHGHSRARSRTVHLALLAAALLGLAAGLWRWRHPALLLVAAVLVYSTLLNTILVAEARHNLPLLPALYAAGAAGWAIAFARRRPALDGSLTEPGRSLAAPR
jgi:CHASE2 domain-containing sensor protein